jgi:two-component system osmolarity sensor histidine kinase EnvZ
MTTWRFKATDRWLLWLVLGLQLLGLVGFVLLVAEPLAKRSAEDLAGLMLISAKTWEELPEDRQPAFAQSLFQDTGVSIERGVLADIERSWRPHWYSDWVAESLRTQGESRFSIQMQHGQVEVFIMIDATPVVIRSDSPKLGGVLIAFMLITFLSVMGTLLSMWWQKRWKRQMLRSQVMLSGLSHDLRTPLTRLQLQLALLPNLDEQLQTRLSDQIQQLSSIINTALALSRSDVKQLNDTVTLSVLWQQWMQDYPDVTFSVNDQACVELAVSPLLTRVVQNLVNNAMVHGKGKVTVQAVSRDSVCAIHVQDEGEGIPEEVWRTVLREEMPKAKGVGLGLLTSYWLCQHLGYKLKPISQGLGVFLT